MCHLWPSSLLLIIEIFVLACMHEIFEENMFFRSLIIAHIYSDLHRAMEPGSTTTLWPVQTLIKAFARARSVISCHEQARPTPCRAPIMHGLYWPVDDDDDVLDVDAQSLSMLRLMEWWQKVCLFLWEADTTTYSSGERSA